MSDPYLYSVKNNVATFSVNDPPWNLMSVHYICLLYTSDSADDR